MEACGRPLLTSAKVAVASAAMARIWPKRSKARWPVPEEVSFSLYKNFPYTSGLEFYLAISDWV